MDGLNDIDIGDPLDLDHPHARGLVGWWKVLPQYRGGTVLRDLSLYGNDGTLTRMDPATDWVNGRLGLGAVDCDGSDDYILLPSLPLSASSSFTQMTWLMTTDRTQRQFIVDLGGSVGHIRIDIDPLGTGTNSLGGYIYTGAHQIVGATVIQNNTWYHAALTKQGTSYEFFVNGTSAGTNSSANPNSSPSSNTLGGRVGAAFDDPLIGQVDDGRIYNRVLSPAEISDIYEDSLVGRYEMLRRVGRRVYSIPAAAPGGEKYWLWARQTQAQIIGGGAL